MYINEWFMPSVRVAALLGYRSFAFGVTIGIRRDTLVKIGGFHSVSSQLADDYRLGELTRGLGLRTVLTPVEVDNFLAERRAADTIPQEQRRRRQRLILHHYGAFFSLLTSLLNHYPF